VVAAGALVVVAKYMVRGVEDSVDSPDLSCKGKAPVAAVTAYLGKLMSGELACLTPGFGEGNGSLSSLPYSSPLEGAGGCFVWHDSTGSQGRGNRVHCAQCVHFVACWEACTV
jgi:hypothetical protein